MFGFLMLFWYVFGIGFLVAAILQKDRWSLVALLALPLGFVQAGQIDHKVLSERRWQEIRPNLEAQLTEAMQTDVPSETNRLFQVKVLRPGVRIVRNNKGNRNVAFVQYRVGIDNGLAYVYSPKESLHEETDKNSALGYALSGFGRIARVESLGDNWYRCYFT
ncbi:MAG: hypothetical protein QM758_11840 [Armatimonas sp.]